MRKARAAHDVITVEGSNGWSVAQATAARFLAIGTTQSYAATRAGCTTRTVQAWLAKPEYQSYVRDLYLDLLGQVEADLIRNLALALECERAVLAGEMKPDDPRHGVSQSVIARFSRFLLAEVEASAPSAPAALIQINGS